MYANTTIDFIKTLSAWDGSWNCPHQQAGGVTAVYRERVPEAPVDASEEQIKIACWWMFYSDYGGQLMLSVIVCSRD